jgi:hypothetical protein
MNIKNLHIKTIIKVALIALLWVTVINRGTLGVIDTDLRLQMSHAWWTGTEEVELSHQAQSQIDPAVGVIGVGGKRYLAYEPGQSILMLPGDWLGTQLVQYFPKASSIDLRRAVVSYLVFVPLNVTAALACFWLLRLMNFGEEIAGLTTIVLLICTTFLAYAHVHQQNNQVLLLVALGYASFLAYIKHCQTRFVVISGFLASAALLMRATSIIHVLTIVFFVVGCSIYQSQNKFKLLTILGFWTLGFLPLWIFGRVFDYVRYGSFWTTGQALATQQFTTDPKWAGFPEFPVDFPFINEAYVGILGVLFSPIKSIFIYDPLLLPCLVIGVAFWKRFSFYIKLYLIVGILNLLLHIMLTSKLIFWGGDWSWGARYHVTSVHLLLIPLIATLIQYILSSEGFILWIMRGILALALMVQIASVTMDYRTEIVPVILPQDLAAEIHSDQFRLGQRFINIICHFNSSFSRQCRNVPILPFDSNFRLPFGANPKIFLPIWRILLAFTIGTTAWFVYTTWPKARETLSESAIRN